MQHRLLARYRLTVKTAQVGVQRGELSLIPTIPEPASGLSAFQQKRWKYTCAAAIEYLAGETTLGQMAKKRKRTRQWMSLLVASGVSQLIERGHLARAVGNAKEAS